MKTIRQQLEHQILADRAKPMLQQAHHRFTKTLEELEREVAEMSTGPTDARIKRQQVNDLDGYLVALKAYLEHMRELDYIITHG